MENTLIEARAFRDLADAGGLARHSNRRSNAEGLARAL